MQRLFLAEMVKIVCLVAYCLLLLLSFALVAAIQLVQLLFMLGMHLVELLCHLQLQVIFLICVGCSVLLPPAKLGSCFFELWLQVSKAGVDE